ncbi:uncharacterized protein N7473_012123 [Penicillium subrubescens]|jgi:hypothetical protein|uniref:Secreted protein n=1 Tax=Penicillium subrubescens TaxID=1316194 RepID=A0A1Q5UPN6_9EURO|nr:uncharacterized protein N7473_012123 [Penicillium subrubescens]KAJ5881070.1 hypothetical protein N7473_012123 [Penicillium subrubescens]OKP14431.1 hypothetical protein PENSUB_14043 [Penicillium subrubescens]
MKFLSTIVLLNSVAMANAESFYAYTCYGCGCDAYQSFGTNIKNSCTNVGSGAAAWGISTGKDSKTYCTLFSEENCGGKSQNVGHKTGQTWGCTNSQIGWVKSVICFD